MDLQHGKTLQNFDESNGDLLRKRLLKSVSTGGGWSAAQTNAQPNLLLNTARTSNSSSMIVSSVQPPLSTVAITHNLVTHSTAPVKIYPNNPYPIHLSTVHVPVQLPGSTTNLNVPVQLSMPANLPFVSGPAVNLPIGSGTTTVPVQLPPGETINVPIQLPVSNQNIHVTGATLPSMPLLHSPQPFIHVHMGTNQRPSDTQESTSLQMDSGNMQVKLTNPNNPQLISTGSVVQIPSSSSSGIQLTLPSNGSGSMLRGAPRAMPHVVYIQTPSGLKAVNSSDVMSQASTSGNPPQIIVRRPVTTSGNYHVISNVTNKTNIAPKLTSSKSLLANNGQPIVIQKSKADKMMVPVTISTGTSGKPTIAYLGPVKKANKPENQSILIQNNQTNPNQKLHFISSMNVQKMQNTKFILPVNLPTAMATKGPIINLQIANGQLQNDSQGNITVMKDTRDKDMPPLHLLPKDLKDGPTKVSTSQSSNTDKSFTVTTAFPGSRAELTGEQEYSLSIPENSSMNDDMYGVSLEEDDGQNDENTYNITNITIQDKGKSLLNKHLIDRTEMPGPAAIMRRSNSDNSDRKNGNNNLKRRISLCNENSTKYPRLASLKPPEAENVEDNRIPSLFCDEQLDKDLEAKQSENEDFKEQINALKSYRHTPQNKDKTGKTDPTKSKRKSTDSITEDEQAGILWRNGVGLLRGSNIQFQTNEFGLIDVVENGDQDEVYLSHNFKYQQPLKERLERGGREKKPTSPEDLYRCEGCGCHGMAAEFVTPEFCSITCQNEVQKNIQKKKEREKAEIMRKRQKIRKILMKKHFSETDMSLDSDEKVLLQRYNTSPGDIRLTEAAIQKLTEEADNEKYSWMCGKNGFSWMRYLEFCKAKAAPVKLFKDPFPYNKNGFKVGMRLEAIDPQNPSMFCVVSVAEVQGYRMRLHFDEYPELYDFWVNADSIDIFPTGYCEKFNRTLHPPEGTSPANFSWPVYLKQVRGSSAPRHLFLHMRDTVVKPNNFRVGMKLEADDRKNNLVCVASISDIMDNRLLINFDSWDEMYDYWVDPASPYIHPVGWAEENGVALTPPNFYKDPDTFSWEEYLAETGAVAAPARAFKTRPPQGFREGMKLEVVDKRVPFLIRVASISSVKAHQVKITYDGWPEEFDVWMDDDSPDIHPVGWCLKTGHPLEPPLSSEEAQVPGPCGVAGCRGLGSLRGGGHKQHGAAPACPYRAPAAPRRPPRRAPPPAPRLVPASTRVTGRQSTKSVHATTPTSDAPKEKLPRGRPPKYRRVEEIKTEPLSDEESEASAPAPPPDPPAPLQVAHHVTELRLPSTPTTWTQENVSALVTRLAGEASGEAVAAARLSGCQLLMASREELVTNAKLKLGPAIKVYAAIRQLRERVA